MRMEDKAYLHIYGSAVFHPYRVALFALLQECAHRRWEAHPSTDNPIVDQSRVLEKIKLSHTPVLNPATAHKRLDDALRLGLFSKLPRGDGPKRTKSYLYFTNDQWVKVQQLNFLFQKIDHVIEVQSSDPHDTWAGSDLVPREVYYNIDADDGLL